MFYVGVDAGSAYTKSVLVKKWGEKQVEVLAYNIIPSEVELGKSIMKAFDLLLRRGKISSNDVEGIIGTGYGKNIVKLKLGGGTATEITCHAKGAKYLFPECRTVIDVGGQDTKVIKLDDAGFVVKFEMNDRCAAGTGRFLEVMSRVLGVDISEFGRIAVKSKSKANITSTCTVFAETEVISLISQGVSREEIIAGLTASIASRIAGLAKIIGVEEKIVMTGGVAKNVGIVKELENMLGHKIHVPKEPMIVGAIGAALAASEL